MKPPPITGHLKCPEMTEKTLPPDPFISQVPLRLQIKVCGQRGSLGISIAGGKGSLPYKDCDEGIFISRVTNGGPSEKAGIHVGDRLIEVNGVSMLGAAHQEAVSALRNAGSCIRMKVLRERTPPGEACRPQLPRVAQDVAGGQTCSLDARGLWDMERLEDCLPQKIQAVVCNGNGFSELMSDLNRTATKLEAEVSTKMDSLPEGKHTMTIPRIILTHPSTSDDDVELLTQIPRGTLLHDLDKSDKCVNSDFYDCAFYPP